VEIPVKHRFAPLLAICCIFLISGRSQEKPLYFVILADTQFGMYESDRGFERETSNYEFAVAAVNRLKPSFVIVLGDLVNKPGDPKQIREFKRISKKIDQSIPVYLVAGNHDVDHDPTPKTLAVYRKKFGRDYYSFRVGPIYGIVLNSTLMAAPRKAEAESQKQYSWLKKELETAKASGAPQIIIFQHHPYFLKDSREPVQFGNMPLECRETMLALLHRYGVRYVFAGHIHSNAFGKEGDLEMVATGPVAMPFGADGSGIRLAAATAAGVQHRYYDFGRMPDRLEIK
jgi:3',5'-cyclic AMP phosphodiesterase CpdA